MQIRPPTEGTTTRGTLLRGPLLVVSERAGTHMGKPICAEVGGGPALRACRRLYRGLEARRLGRSIRGLISLAADLSVRKFDFRSLTGGFNTSTASSRLLFHILASVAEMEREAVINHLAVDLEKALGAS
jgi:hypothetical protein